MGFVRRSVFFFIVLFWAVMNIWLWRSEIGGKYQLGSAVPAEAVWQKILTAPDDSALEIFRRGQKIGHCRWRANVGEEFTTGKIASESEVEGRVKHLSGYTLDVEGNFLLEELAGRLRVDLHASFATNNQWTQFTARASARPQMWELQARSAEQTVRLSGESEGEKWERVFSFSDLTDPTKLLRQFGSGLPAGLMALPGSFSVPAGTQLAFGLKWEARKDWFSIGHSKVRAYRLSAKVLDRSPVVVFVSRVGEILRVELPHDIVLVNDAFVAL
jgi:hypothetical protein